MGQLTFVSRTITIFIPKDIEQTFCNLLLVAKGVENICACTLKKIIWKDNTLKTQEISPKKGQENIEMINRKEKL